MERRDVSAHQDQVLADPIAEAGEKIGIHHGQFIILHVGSERWAKLLIRAEAAKISSRHFNNLIFRCPNIKAHNLYYIFIHEFTHYRQTYYEYKQHLINNGNVKNRVVYVCLEIIYKTLTCFFSSQTNKVGFIQPHDARIPVHKIRRRLSLHFFLQVIHYKPSYLYTLGNYIKRHAMPNK